MLRWHAAELVRAAGYVNAGTVEFLYEPRRRLLSFLEVNTRLQVEHPVTEVTTGVDIVKLQLHIAAGGTLAEIGPAEPPARGHAIEARLTAEDMGAGRTWRAAADGTDTDPAEAAADALAALRSLVLGYDADEHEARRQLQRLAAAHAELPAEDPQVLAGEAEILQTFADVSALWRSRRVPGESQADDEAAVDDEAARNPQEYMHAYLRSRDVEAEGLPESFRIKLRRTLAHYGRTDLERSPIWSRALPDLPGSPPGVRARPGRVGPAAVAAWPAGVAGRRRRPRRVPADHRPAGVGHPVCGTRHRRPGPAGALPLLRRPADRGRASPGPAAGARGTRPAVV